MLVLFFDCLVKCVVVSDEFDQPVGHFNDVIENGVEHYVLGLEIKKR